MGVLEILFCLGLFLILYTYVFYVGILSILAKFKKGETNDNGEYFPTVSMVIPAYNEETVIKQKMENCRRLAYPVEKLEILVGTDGSTDKTNLLIEQYAPPNVNYFPSPGRKGKSKALKDLIAKAKGEIVVLSDANTIYNPYAVTALVRHFVNPDVGAVCGRLILVNPNKNVGGWGESKYWQYENIIKKLEGAIHSTIGATGGIYALRRDLIPSLPDDRLVSDDLVMALLIAGNGHRVIYDKDAVAIEATTRSIKDEFIRKKRIGIGNFQALPMIAHCLNPRKGFVAFALWSHKIIRWFTPFILIAVFIINILLLGNQVYNILFSLQLLFYGFSFLGWKLMQRNKKYFIFSYPLYFVAAHYALFLAFFEMLKGIHNAQWEQTKR